MIAPLTIAQRLAAARLGLLPDAISATLRPLYPDVTVRTHPGRIDVADIIAGDIFLPPMIAVAVTEFSGDGQVPGQMDVVADCAAYIVTEEMALAGRAVGRDQVGLAIALGMLEILNDLDLPRWGMTNITPPRDPRGRALFSALSYEKGTAYYSVTWKQVLFAEGEPMPGPVPTETLETVEDGDIIVVWPTPDDEGGP